MWSKIAISGALLVMGGALAASVVDNFRLCGSLPGGWPCPRQSVMRRRSNLNFYNGMVTEWKRTGAERRKCLPCPALP
ncbi:GL14661 [Drosophila persimilis]|uniref:GL14661 n=1 Tax=Drosophila persimilis TaxID=7234 RepID=B4GVK1_DROPE|nr:GL14661 [Drosophila persimilis]